jgi:hypothetical protein
MVSFVPALIKMRKRLHKLLFYTLLMGVYGIFFSVESFYNFEGQTNTRDTLRYASVAGVHGTDVSVARSMPLHSATSHGIRLNKRYHQENIPPCPVLAPTVREYALTPLILGIYRPADLPKPVLLHRPLRGPPALS